MKDYLEIFNFVSLSFRGSGFVKFLGETRRRCRRLVAKNQITQRPLVAMVRQTALKVLRPSLNPSQTLKMLLLFFRTRPSNKHELF